MTLSTTSANLLYGREVAHAQVLIFPGQTSGYTYLLSVAYLQVHLDKHPLC